MPAEDFGTVLTTEVESHAAFGADEIPELREVLEAIGDRGEVPARPEHPDDFAQSAVDVLKVVEHPQRDDTIEGAVGERKGLRICDCCSYSSATS